MKNDFRYGRLISIWMVAGLLLYAAPGIYALETESSGVYEVAETVQEAADTADTAEAFSRWLEQHKTEGGTLKLTADIQLQDFTYLRFSQEPLVVDTGEYTISVAGNVELLCAGLTICGDGGERGVLRSEPGGVLSISQLKVESRNGYAVYQDEGSGFAQENCTEQAAVRYAQTPFVWNWEATIALVGPDQTAEEALPETVLAGVNENGGIQRRMVPVSWDLAGNESDTLGRLRFDAQGNSPNYAALTLPLCTVVYDDFPLTFTALQVVEQSWFYRIYGDFTKPDAEYPLYVEQEYSFDGRNWISYYMAEIVADYEGFSFEFDKDAEESYYWNTQVSPQVYIRLKWKNEETTHYSNVLRFSADSLKRVEDIGGNRGGGTGLPGITERPVPSKTPAPTESPVLTSAPTQSPVPTQAPSTGDTMGPQPTIIPGATSGSVRTPDPSLVPDAPLGAGEAFGTAAAPRPTEKPQQNKVGRAIEREASPTPVPEQEEASETATTTEAQEMDKSQNGAALAVGIVAVAVCLFAAIICLSAKTRKALHRRFIKRK